MIEQVVKPKNVAVIYEYGFRYFLGKSFRDDCAKEGINIVFDQSYSLGPSTSSPCWPI